MTLVEAARLLSLSPATLRRQIANGRLSAHKIGRDWHLDDDEVRRYQAVSLGRPGRRVLPDTLGLMD